MEPTVIEKCVAATLRLLEGSLVGFAGIVSFLLIGKFLGMATWVSLVFSIVMLVVLFWKLSRRIRFFVTGGLVFLAALWYASLRPSHDRDWQADISVLPRIQIEGAEMRIFGYRDFRWSSTSTYEAAWRDEVFDLDKLSGLDVIVEPFADSELAAHVMLGFRFSDGRRLVVSVETRKEVGESYSLLGGAARQLELIYVFATPEDVLDLRIAHRGSRVYAFPLKVDGAFMRRILEELCASANALREEPKFYATLRHNCTTTLLRHVNRIREEDIGLRYEIVFPAKLGELLHRLGYMDTDLPYQEARERFLMRSAER